MKVNKLIDLDFLPDRDLVHTGLLLKSSRLITVVLSYDTEHRKFDGISVFKTKDISKYRYWDKDEKKRSGPTTGKILLVFWTSIK